MSGHRNLATRFGHGLQLLTEGSEQEVPRLKWIHCANEGVYRGHHQGEFVFTPQVFDTFVRNFRHDPRFKAGAANDNGEPVLNAAGEPAGAQPVLQFDYEHASEMPPWEGTIPQSGAPAPAWVIDVEVRMADGVAQLWALADLGTTIRGQIQRKEYRFVSIAFTMEGKNWLTGDPIGPALTSIAFTNQPFMRDIEPLAAANRQTTTSKGSTMSKTADELQRELTAALQAHNTFCSRLCRALQLRSNLLDDDAIGAAVEEAVGKGLSLDSLLESLDVPNPADALKTVAALQEARGKLSELQQQIDDALSGAVKQDEAAIPKDVEAAMSAQGFKGDPAKKALTAHRTLCTADALKKLGDKRTLEGVITALAAGRAHFFSEHNVKPGSTQQRVSGLDQPIVQRGTQQLPAPTELQLSGAAEGVVDVSLFEGVNTTQRIMSYLSSKDPQFTKLSIEKRVQRASLFRQQNEIVDENVRAA